MKNYIVPSINPANRHSVIYHVCNHSGEVAVVFRQKKRATNVVQDANRRGIILHRSDFTKQCTLEFPKLIKNRHGMKKGQLLNVFASGIGQYQPLNQ